MSGAQTIKAWLSHPQTKERIDQALMGYLPGDAFAEQCIMVSRDPELAKCAPDSLLTAFLSCAQLGLLPGPQKLVQLIPRRGSVDVMITARGYKTLMERLPAVARVRAVLVHTLDSFKRTDDGPIHDWDPFADGREFNGPEDLRGGYLEATFTDGSKDWHYVTKAEIEKVRACARSQNVWAKWFKEMAQKTLYRQAWARMFLPSSGLAQVNQAIDQAESLDRLQHQEDPSRVGGSPQAAHVQHAPQLSSPAAAALTYEPEIVDSQERSG